MNFIEFTDINKRLCQVDPETVGAIVQYKADSDGPTCGLHLRGGQTIVVLADYDEVVAALGTNPKIDSSSPQRQRMPCPTGCNNGKRISPWGGVGGIDYYRCEACGKSFNNP